MWGCDQGQIYMYTPQYKVSRMKVSREQMDRYRWHRGKWAASYTQRKIFKKGGGKEEEG